MNVYLFKTFCYIKNDKILFIFNFTNGKGHDQECEFKIRN